MLIDYFKENTVTIFGTFVATEIRVPNFNSAFTYYLPKISASMLVGSVCVFVCFSVHNAVILPG